MEKTNERAVLRIRSQIDAVAATKAAVLLAVDPTGALLEAGEVLARRPPQS